ncbi:MAG: hypothetical protein LBL87_05055 [Ruminococcus sp.]|jgi:hypothetical protein|nr:hypothetical protein [Ruminococcus sp.]
MRKNSAFYVVFKTTLSFFSAAVLCAVFFAFPSSAAGELKWNDVIAAQLHSQFITTDTTVIVENDSTGRLQLQGGTLTVIGTADNFTGNLEVKFNTANPSLTNVIWDADVTGSGNVIIDGTGNSVSITGNISTSSNQIALNIPTGITSVSMSGCSISSTRSTAINLGCPATLTNVNVSSTQLDAIYTTDSITINGGTFSGRRYGISVTNGSVFSISNATVTATNAINSAVVYNGSGTADVVFNNVTVENSGGTYNAVLLNGTKSINITNSVFRCVSGNTGSALKIDNPHEGATITNSTFSNLDSTTHTAIDCKGIIEINGTTSVSSGYDGIYITNGTLTVNGGTIQGGANGNGISLNSGTTGYLNGGTISTLSTNSVKAAVDMQSSYVTVTIDGATVNGGSVYGVKANNTNHTITMRSGSVSGFNGLFTQGPTYLYGGTISGTGNTGTGVNAGASLTIVPADGTPVLLKGNNTSVNKQPTSLTAAYYIKSNNYDGTSPSALQSSVTPYVRDAADKYVQFWYGKPNYTLNVIGGTANSNNTPLNVDFDDTVAIAPTPGKVFIRWEATGITLADPSVANQEFTMPLNPVTLTAILENLPPPPPTPTTSTPSPEPSNNNSGSGGEPYYNPTTPNSVSYSKDEYILVIATLNKSGSVNSKETAKDMWLAEQRAKQFNIPKIYLKIPEGGTGISAAAMKKQYDTAKKTRLYLLFDYYETVIDKNGKEKNNVIGSVFTPVNAKSGQFLTGIKFNSKNIDSVESYIKKKWNTTILGSFETTQKGGWYDTAKITIDIDNLGFSADNGTRLYALIYDTKAKKFYQTDVTVSKGNVVVNTNRSGIVVIVNKSVK